MVSFLAGGVADTGVDPVPLMKASLQLMFGLAQSRATLGECAGGAEYFPGGGVRLPYCYRSARYPG